MRIEVVRSGGLLGAPRRAEVDLEALPPARRKRLTRLVAGAGLADLPARVGSPAPDRFQWDLTIHAGGEPRRVRVHEAGAPERLCALLRALFEEP